MKNNSIGKIQYIFDSFKESGKERASTNGNKEITDWGLTDIIQHIDEHTEKDSEFFEDFTKAVFEEFGWKFYSKEAGDESWDELVQRKYNK